MENGFNSSRSTPTSRPTVPPLGNFGPALHLRGNIGDLVEIDRKIFTQWAIYFGDGKVVYVAGEKADFPTNGEARVRKSTLTACAKGCLVRVNNKIVPAKERGFTPLEPAIVIENARKQIGRKVEFNLFEKNSEHYSTEWKFGKGWSDQAETAHKVMSIFKSKQPKHLPSNRHSAPGSLHAVVTGLAVIFQQPSFNSTGPTSARTKSLRQIRRQSSQ